MEKIYMGTLVEESLDDNRILNDVDVLSIKISKDENPQDRWHLYKVRVSKDDIKKLSLHIKKGWYMHFWEGENVVAVFKDKTFDFIYGNKNAWKDAIEYGLSLGIPREQLDFVIEE
jgi:hypothetical protein